MTNTKKHTHNNQDRSIQSRPHFCYYTNA